MLNSQPPAVLCTRLASDAPHGSDRAQATLQPNIDIGCQFMDVAFIQVGGKHILKHEDRLFFRLQLFAGRQQRQVAQPYSTSKKTLTKRTK